MAKTKKQDIPADLLKLMHPDLPFDDSSVQEPAAKTASTSDYAAQMAELSANMKRLEDQNSQLQRTNLALMGQPMVQTPNFGPAEINLDGLPDPVTDPKGYAAAIVQRGDQVLQARARQQDYQRQQADDLTAKTNAIWEQFTKQHPELADKADLVEAAAGKAVNQARTRGIDGNKYIFAATDQFFDDTLNILKGWGVEGKAKDDADDEAPSRTAGIPGGLDSGGRMSAGKDPDEERIPTLMEEVRGWKLKTGFM